MPLLKKIAFQLVPHGNNRATNAAKRAIQIFESHLSGVASVDPNFPLGRWDCLIKQSTLTLNLLQSS